MKSKILLILLIFCGVNLNAATITSVSGGGNWSYASTWIPVGVPTASDDVIITSPVVIDGDVEAKSITINADGGELSCQGLWDSSQDEWGYEIGGQLPTSITISELGSFEIIAGTGDTPANGIFFDQFTNNTVYFLGSGSISGPVTFTNLVLAGATNFTTDNITVQGILELSGSSAVVSGNSPNYFDSNSKLLYTGTGAVSTRLEWVTGATQPGVPAQVELSGSTALALTGISPRTIDMLTIGTGSSVALSTETGGDLYLNYSLNTTSTGTIDSKTRLIKFLGYSGDISVGSNFLYDVEINNVNNAFLHTNLNIRHSLVFTDGLLETYDKKVILVSGATVSESSGKCIVGEVQSTMTVGTGAVSDWAGLGVALASGADSPGTVVLTRLTGTKGIQTVNGKSGIAATWSFDKVINRNLTFGWYPGFDNGKTLTTAHVWGSPSASSVWSDLSGSDQDASISSITATNTTSKFFTVSDAANPLAINAPTTQASEIVFPDIQNAEMTIGWTNGNGNKRAVFVKEGVGIISDPADNTTYTASSNWVSKGTQLESSEYYCVYNNSGSSVTLTGLKGNTGYAIQIFEYNGTAASEVYNTSTAADNPQSQSTLPEFAGGDGTVADPYQIETDMQLNKVRNYLSSFFILMNDIDLSGSVYLEVGNGWNPIGNINTDLGSDTWDVTNAPFTGNFNGNGHNISNLTITRGQYDAIPAGEVGLFGTISPTSAITGLGLLLVNISGDGNAGGIAGTNKGTITNCYVEGDISADDYVGGLIGILESGTVSKSYSSGTVTALATAGGIVGLAFGGTLENCYARNSISASEAGGLIGRLFGSVVSKCFATGLISGGGAEGGLFGENPGYNVTSCFWDTETSLQETSAGGGGDFTGATGKTTAEMKSKSTFTGWDFETPVWSMKSDYNDGYPNLDGQVSALAAPTTQASEIVFSTVKSTEMTIGWTNGDGLVRTVFVKQTNSGTSTPVDNTTYIANTTFTSGAQIGSTVWYCVYNGTGTSVTVTGLTAATDYIAQVFEYNGTSGTEKYNGSTAADNPKSQTTNAASTITSFTPTSAGTGTFITIMGTNFTGATAVSFGGTAAASFKVDDSETISAMVAGGTTGVISVTTPGGTATSSGTFTFKPAYLTNLANVIDASLGGSTTEYNGQAFTTGINGRTLSSVDLSITLNGADAVVKIYSSVAEAMGSEIASLTGTYVSGSIYNFTPATPITLSANTTYWLVLYSTNSTNFDNTVDATYTGTGTIPATNRVAYSANSGGRWEYYSASDPDPNYSEPFMFALYGDIIPAPTITSFTPTSAGTGATVTITGTNFTGATAVSFSGTAGTSFAFVNATSITAVVASGTTGTISVTTPGGTATSGDTFTYIACSNPTSGGTIASAQTICSGNAPAAFTSSAAATGHTGTLEYKWQSSTTSSSGGFNDITSSNGETYSPGALSATTWYKRLARVSCKSDWTGAVESNVVAVTINPLPSAPTAGNNGPVFVGASLSLTATTVTSATYAWTGPDGFTSSAQNPTVSVTATTTMAGDYSVTASVNGCPSPAGTTTVTVILLPITVSGSNTKDGKYASLTKTSGAFAAINSANQTGKTIAITITGDVTDEDGAKALTGALGMWTSLTINPGGGAARIISGSVAAPLIDLNGADNVSIDGLNTEGNALTISNTSTSATNYTSTIRFINDATNNTVKYCTLKGSSTATVSTKGGVLFFGLGSNSTNTIDHNNITNSDGINRPVAAIYSYGAGGINSGNRITNNNIYDFFNPTSNSQGIYIWNNSSDWTITGNNFYETSAPLAPTGAFTYDVIRIDGGSGNNFMVSDNFIGGSAADHTGTFTINSAYAHLFNGINLSVGATTASSVQNNSIQRIAYTTAGSEFFNGIRIKGGNVNAGTITGNTIGSTTGNGSITLTSLTAIAISFGIYNSGTGIVNIENNKVGAITTVGSATLAHSFYAIRSDYGTNIISNNTIGSISTSNSIIASSTSSSNSQSVYGIYSGSTGTATISGNTIANLTNASTYSMGEISGINSAGGTRTITNNTVRDLTTANSSTVSVSGIYFSSNVAAVQTITGNTIYNLSNSYASYSGNVIGLYYLGFTTASTVSKNFIHSLSATSANAALYGLRIDGGTATYSNNIISLGSGITTGNAIYGINLVATGSNTLNLYHNTIDIEGTASGITRNTYALSNAGLATRVYKNNIFNNSRAGGTTGKHYAVSVSYNTNLTIDYNDYFAPNGVLGVYNSVNKTILTDWQTATGQDGHSLNVIPNFSGAGGTSATNYLPSAACLIAITGTGVSTDYGLNTRSSTYPAMGAWEYTVTPPCANPTSGGTIGSDQTICAGSSPAAFTSSVAATGHTGTLEYKWQSSTTSSSGGFNDISSSNSETYAPGALTSTTWYKRLARVSCKIDWTGAVGSNVVAVTVTPLPTVASASVSPTSVCGSGQVTFTASSSGSGSIKWYDALTGGSEVTTLNPTISTTTTNYAEATENSCHSAARTAVTATVIELPAAPSATAAQTFCAGATVNDLTVTGTAPKWYAAQTGGTAKLTTEALVTDTHYWASQTVGACESTRTEVAVTINTTPSAPTAGNNGPVCVGTTLSLTASTVADATYAWTGPNGFTSSEQNPTVSLSATTGMAGEYSVAAIVNGCNSSEGTTTPVVNTIPAAPAAIGGGESFVYIGSSTPTFTDDTPGGSWSVVNGSGSATAAGGVVTGVTAGTVTVTYTVTSSGCSNSATKLLTVVITTAATQIAINALTNNQSATVGTALPTPVSVTVRDAGNNPVSGVGVTFAILSGGGSVTYETPTTNSSGIAAIGSWILGTTAGTNTLTVTSTGLTGSPLTFTATGTAGAVTTVLPSGDASIASGVESNGYTAVSKDVFGNLVSADSYTWSVTNGTGSGIVTNLNSLTGILAGTLTMKATSLQNGAISGNLPVTVYHGAATHLSVETAADGSCPLISAHVPATGMLTVYAISRDDATNFVANVSATAWSLPTRTGSVADGDLAGSGTSALFTGHLSGTATIQATLAGLTPVSSGTVTVTGPTTFTLKVFLEGPYNMVTGAMNTTLNQPIPGPVLIPLTQPYNTPPWNHAGGESAGSIPAGVVDWVLVELRQAATPERALPSTLLSGWPKACFLNSTGQIVDLDGTTINLSIGSTVITGDLYVVIRHRNHVAIMSSAGMTLSGDTYSYDFTTAVTQAYGGTAGYKQLGSSVFGMVAGDADSDGNIYVSDFAKWALQFFQQTQYLPSDYDQDGNVYVSDFNIWAANFMIANVPALKSLKMNGSGVQPPMRYKSQVPDNQ